MMAHTKVTPNNVAYYRNEESSHCGRICFNGRKVNLSHVFAGQNVGVTQVGDRLWLVTFMHYDLGYFDDETCGSNRSKIRSARKCYLCLRRNERSPM
jgi:hypothetical protein